MKRKGKMRHCWTCGLLFSIACSASDPSPAEEVHADAARGVAFSLHFGPFEAAPGSEGVVCLDAPGPKEDVWISGWRSEALGVHHANVYVRTSGSPYRSPTPCGGGATLGGPAFFSATAPHTEARLDAAPEYAGAALKLPAASSLIWDVHYVNPTATAAEASIDIEFYEATDHSRPVSAFTFNGGATMAVPPGATQTLTFECPGPVADTAILTTSAHVHAHNVRASLSFGGQERYVSTDWSEPPTTVFDSLHAGAFVVPKGAGASWSCEIHNTTGATLRYSNEVQTGEMCILFGFAIGEKWSCALP